MSLTQADIDRIADAVVLRLPTVQAIAKAVAVELRRSEQVSDDMEYMATLPPAEIKRILKERRGK